ncbi:HDOD domain-containing protein [Pseudomonas sp. 10B1]|uniref:HDOD domain-containing protein n=1 Tax=unclassified Pseudomonas TaxID=196821 RepID=UPI002AB399F3|nr:MULTISPECIES: HDOD domain-containing protein [unclassified Pseudomonas]MDY7562409.1 HDOD domain-containing protein [Pseudomonas sp. AB6]MEA9978018.1 HDOD domain-containing protein [Pseudomonas sp. RTS4]MEA9996800.1 HDOD domain-containing protein [Pseudomonas sp. AA4]MEB0086330.1 HDOD domain-containing protein [Pseudomonas sp. RTI1]MEB0126471.1 HDOD domain-containing protein [Pseudomonas sp. CCC1.2]
MTAVDLPAAPRVLIADADPAVRNALIELVLNVRGDASLEVCADGPRALEWLDRHPVNLIIADWDLPGTDGLSLLRGVRQQQQWPAVPFILLSNRSDSASVREAVLHSPTAYLTKPLNLNGLRQRLESLLLPAGEYITPEARALIRGMTLSQFLEKRREIADGAPLSLNVREAVSSSQNKTGVDLILLEKALHVDPHVTAVLIAAANGAAQHMGKVSQTLLQALRSLGPATSVNLILDLATKQNAVLKNDLLIGYARRLWSSSRLTAHYAQSLARLLELDQERCYCAGLLHNLGDLTVLRCMQEWISAGGQLDEDAVELALTHFSAGFGSALRTRWRLPLELRELVAAVYQFSAGVQSREALVMAVAAQLAQLGPEEEVDTLANSKAARLLKVGASELSRLRKK